MSEEKMELKLLGRRYVLGGQEVSYEVHNGCIAIVVRDLFGVQYELHIPLTEGPSTLSNVTSQYENWLQSVVRRSGRELDEVEVYQHLAQLRLWAFRVSDSLKERTEQSPLTAPHHGASTYPTPPRLGERILYLVLSKKDRENLIGDLAEEFGEIQIKHGGRFAKVWYWKQVGTSVLPLLKKAIRWGLYASIMEWIRRHI